MPPVARRGALVGTVTAAAVLAAPGAASAHGIGASSETESVAGFVLLGYEHMLLGWDHLLFVAGVLLLAREPRRAAKMISVFALGHSITLFAATVAGWRLNPTLVDVVVALSLVFVGVVGLVGRPQKWRWFAAAVFGFGLVHGLGLSTRLQDVGLPSDGLIPRVLAFNVGVELGQLTAVLALVVIVQVVRRAAPRLRVPRPSHSAFAAFAAVGLVAAVALAFTGGEEPARAEVLGGCEVRERMETFPLGAGHPFRAFYEPDEEAPVGSFGHVIGDGFVIVQYQPELPAAQLAELRTFVTDPASGRVVGGAAPGQTEAVKAVNAYETVVCDTFDLEAVEQFTADWFADPRSEPVE